MEKISDFSFGIEIEMENGEIVSLPSMFINTHKQPCFCIPIYEDSSDLDSDYDYSDVTFISLGWLTEPDMEDTLQRVMELIVEGKAKAQHLVGARTKIINDSKLSKAIFEGRVSIVKD